MISMRFDGASIGCAICVADTFGKRFMGLMFRKTLPEGSGLLLMPCSSIHMCFMRMALDVVYMDSDFLVLGVQAGLKPWKLGAIVKGARIVLELPAGTINRCGIRQGMAMKVELPSLAGESLPIDEDQ